MPRIRREKQPLFESAFKEKNREIQLNIRLFDSMNDALITESKRSGHPQPDLVREAIAFLLFPRYLKHKIDEGAELDSDERALLAAYRESLSDLAEFCREIDESLEKLELQTLEKRIAEHPEDVVKAPFVQKLIKDTADQIVFNLFGITDKGRFFVDADGHLTKILDEKRGKGKTPNTDKAPPKSEGTLKK